VGQPGRQLKIGVYSPFMGSTVGGGEKYLGVTAETLRDTYPGHSVEILSPVPVDVARYEEMLGLDLSGITFRSANISPGGARGRLAGWRPVRVLRDLAVSFQVRRLTAAYDLLISMVYVLPAVSRARRGAILCQFPYPRRTPVHHRVLRRLLLGREIDDFQLVVAQSEFVRGWVERLWKRPATVVNPPIDVPAMEPDWEVKEPVILSVGRFFTGGHNKRHDVMVSAFRDLVESGGAEGWELVLIGSLHQDADDLAYFRTVRELARGYPVSIRTDVSGEELADWYQRASLYWHAAGYGADAEQRPADLEHFGMTTAEAMARGAVPLVIAKGGQPEVVEAGVSGHLWTEPGELVAWSRELIADAGQRRRMGEAARERSRVFSRAEFKRRMAAALSPLVEELEATAPGPGRG
jgi:glycosyltransferase involved in cell wall biosynthesis